MRLLRQIADLYAFCGFGIAAVVMVKSGHDPHQCRLAGTVDAKHADFSAREKRKSYVLEDLASAGIGLC